MNSAIAKLFAGASGSPHKGLHANHAKQEPEAQLSTEDKNFQADAFTPEFGFRRQMAKELGRQVQATEKECTSKKMVLPVVDLAAQFLIKAPSTAKPNVAGSAAQVQTVVAQPRKMPPTLPQARMATVPSAAANLQAKAAPQQTAPQGQPMQAVQKVAVSQVEASAATDVDSEQPVVKQSAEQATNTTAELPAESQKPVETAAKAQLAEAPVADTRQAQPVAPAAPVAKGRPQNHHQVAPQALPLTSIQWQVPVQQTQTFKPAVLSQAAKKGVAPLQSGLPAGASISEAALGMNAMPPNVATATELQPAQSPMPTDAVPEAPTLTNQIVQALDIRQASSGKQITIQLNPPELGQVRLTLEARGEQIRAVMRVDDPATLAQLRMESPALVQRLAESGLDVRRLDIVQTEHASSHHSSLASNQDSSAHRQQQAWDWHELYEAGRPEALYQDDALGQNAELVGAAASEGSINTWA